MKSKCPQLIRGTNLKNARVYSKWVCAGGESRRQDGKASPLDWGNLCVSACVCLTRHGPSGWKGEWECELAGTKLWFYTQSLLLLPALPAVRSGSATFWEPPADWGSDRSAHSLEQVGGEKANKKDKIGQKIDPKGAAENRRRIPLERTYYGIFLRESETRQNPSKEDQSPTQRPNLLGGRGEGGRGTLRRVAPPLHQRRPIRKAINMTSDRVCPCRPHALTHNRCGKRTCENTLISPLINLQSDLRAKEKRREGEEKRERESEKITTFISSRAWDGPWEQRGEGGEGSVDIFTNNGSCDGKPVH